MNRLRVSIGLLLAMSLLLTFPGNSLACGGFFCTTIPVDQAAEQIIFTMDEGRIGAYVQINYTGAPDTFAWVLPVPSVPTLAQADMATFRDLSRLTAPIFIPPPAPDCLRRPMPAAMQSAARAEGVDVLASGVVGPFGYHVVASPDPQEMVRWLRDNGYRIESSMEPLNAAYTDEGMAFLAMKLQPGKNSRDITPIKLEYDSTQPMIPLRLTAVAAQPNMGVLVWIFGQRRTEPRNFVDMTISDGEILFSPFGQNNYRQVVARAADQAGGRAFVTEYAGSTAALFPRTVDPTLQMLSQKYAYLSRFYTRISPEEMTVDPVFDYATGKGDVSNVHDLSRLPSPFDCTDDPATFKPISGAGAPPPVAQAWRTIERFDASGAPRGGLLALVMVGAAVVTLGARRRGPLSGNGVGRGGSAIASARGWASLAVLGTGRRFRSFLGPLVKVSPAAARLLLLEAVLLQGFHEAEHVVQVVQRYLLDIKAGNGLLGSLFDLEPVHIAYNLALLGLLGLAYLGCKRNGAIPARPALVLGLLGVALVAQSYHSVEHVVKMVQYLESGRNGVPGILGHWVPVIWLHLWLNTLIYLPVLLAFLLGGFPRALGSDMRALLPARRAPSLASQRS